MFLLIMERSAKLIGISFDTVIYLKRMIPGPLKVQAIMSGTYLRMSVKFVDCYIALTSYCRRHIKGFVSIAEP